MIAVCSGLASLVLVVAVVSLVVRVRRASAIERQQLAWLGWAAGVVLAGVIAGAALAALGVPESITSYFNVVPLAALAVVRYQLRIIERDAWDERAHLDLIACLQTAGRHGEARRRYGAYAARMRELDLPAAGFPARTAT